MDRRAPIGSSPEEVLVQRRRLADLKSKCCTVDLTNTFNLRTLCSDTLITEHTLQRHEEIWMNSSRESKDPMADQVSGTFTMGCSTPFILEGTNLRVFATTIRIN